MNETLLSILTYIGYVIFAVIFFTSYVAWIMIFCYYFIFHPIEKERDADQLS